MDKDYDTLDNVIVIPNGYDYEKMLIKNGNAPEIITAVNIVNDDSDYYGNYKKKQKSGWKPRRIMTDKPPCVACGQPIFEDEPEPEMIGLDEEEKKLYRCMTSSDGKAKYALAVAECIVKKAPIGKRFPKEVLKLFVQMEKDFGMVRRSEYHGIEVIREAAGNSGL